MASDEKTRADEAERIRLEEVDEACESFEKAWNSGAKPQIEDYVQGVDKETVAILWQELMLIELQRIRATGHLPTVEEYRRRFPQQSQLIRPEWFQDRPDGPPQLSAGERVDGFVLKRELGRGGSGVVWLAQDEELQRQVALKFFANSSDSRHAHGSALYEARVAALLSHPQIVPVYDKGNCRGWDYIATRYIAGQPLHKWRQSVKPDFDEIARLCGDIAEAVHYAHERGITHRDLKPANVLVDAAGLPYITDFGLAKRADAESHVTASGQLMGTQGYMSPEQAMGKSHRADRRSDIYSIGVMLYELLTGVKPFRGEFIEVLQATLSKNATPPRQVNPSVPQALEDICLKCMRKSPALRYATAKELADDLHDFLDKEKRSSRSLPRLEAIRDSLHVHRRKAVAVIAVSAAAAFWQLGRQPKSPDAGQGSQPPHDQPVRVKLTADPPKSELAIMAIDPATGLFKPQDPVHTPHADDYELELIPGDYLITARYGDRFHEVYRHIPWEGEPHGFYVTFPWEWKQDRRGKFVVPPIIKVPDDGVSDGMALVSIDETSDPGNLQALPKSFYVDPAEFTEGDYLNAFGALPTDQRFTGRDAPNFPIRVCFDLAMRAAEKVGKRLPDEFEFEYMATDRYTKAFPWGDQVPAAANAVGSFGVAGTPEFDVVNFGGTPVFGLASNLAEWTMSLPLSKSDQNPIPPWEWGSPMTRLVRGGTYAVVKEDPRVNATLRDPSKRTLVKADEWHSGLGFRCVRSVKPRWNREDFQAHAHKPSR